MKKKKKKKKKTNKKEHTKQDMARNRFAVENEEECEEAEFAVNTNMNPTGERERLW